MQTIKYTPPYLAIVLYFNNSSSEMDPTSGPVVQFQVRWPIPISKDHLMMVPNLNLLLYAMRCRHVNKCVSTVVYKMQTWQQVCVYSCIQDVDMTINVYLHLQTSCRHGDQCIPTSEIHELQTFHDSNSILYKNYLHVCSTYDI